jgi:hypothetical protein
VGLSVDAAGAWQGTGEMSRHLKIFGKDAEHLCHVISLFSGSSVVV